MSKLNAKGKQAYKLVERLLYARRSANVKREQEAYDKLRNWCEQNGADMSEVIDQIRSYMKTNEAAPSLNGIV